MKILRFRVYSEHVLHILPEQYWKFSDGSQIQNHSMDRRPDSYTYHFYFFDANLNLNVYETKKNTKDGGCANLSGNTVKLCSENHSHVDFAYTLIHCKITINRDSGMYQFWCIARMLSEFFSTINMVTVTAHMTHFNQSKKFWRMKMEKKMTVLRLLCKKVDSKVSAENSAKPRCDYCFSINGKAVSQENLHSCFLN